MAERLVDILNSDGAVVHTFPITLGGSDTASDIDYQTKALEAAAHAQLVPDAELKSLTARMHISRGGALAPYGDNRDTSSETRETLEEAVRERAYFLWKNWMAALREVLTVTGIVLVTSTFASALISSGSRMAVLKVGPKSIGTKPAPSRHTDLAALPEFRRLGRDAKPQTPSAHGDDFRLDVQAREEGSNPNLGHAVAVDVCVVNFSLGVVQEDGDKSVPVETFDNTSGRPSGRDPHNAASGVVGRILIDCDREHRRSLHCTVQRFDWLSRCSPSEALEFSRARTARKTASATM